MQREQHLLLRSMDECSVVAMECTPDRDLLLIQIPVAKMKRSNRPFHFSYWNVSGSNYVICVDLNPRAKKYGYQMSGQS